jgi:Trk K+ transport system NAD-binding subunit
MDGKIIKDIKLPNDCLLVGIRRGNKEIIPRGNTKVYSGDQLLVLVNESNASLIREELTELGSSSNIYRGL